MDECTSAQIGTFGRGRPTGACAMKGRWLSGSFASASGVAAEAWADSRSALRIASTERGPVRCSASSAAAAGLFDLALTARLKPPMTVAARTPTGSGAIV